MLKQLVTGGRGIFSRLFLLGFSALVFMFCSANGCVAMPDVKLLKQYDGQSVSFAFEISDFDDKRLDYEQSIKHASQAGTSTSAQSGSMHILSNGKGITAWVRIRNHPSSRYIITIKLFDHGQMLYEHRYKLGAGDLNGS